MMLKILTEKRDRNHLKDHFTSFTNTRKETKNIIAPDMLETATELHAMSIAVSAKTMKPFLIFKKKSNPFFRRNASHRI
jgi:hypothetical protein